MSASSKITQSGAFGNEYSYTGPNIHGGWGTTPPNTPLKSDKGMSYLTFEHGFDPLLERDASINSRAFQTGEREMGRPLDNPLTFNNRCEGVDGQFAWMFGWEGRTQKVTILNTTNFCTAPSGSIYKQGVNNHVFLRSYQSRTITNKILYWVVLATPTVAPTPTGVLTLATQPDIVYTSVTDMFEHTYEISDDGRAFRSFTAAELTLLGTQATSDDIRTCMASLAKKFPKYLMRFDNTKCYKFGFKWSPAKFTEVSTNWLGYEQARVKNTETAEYNKVDFDMLCPMVEANNIYSHNQSRFEIGLASAQYNGNNFTYFPVTDMSVDVEIPLQKQQDTESGLFFSDPVLSGPITISAEATITHSKDEQFMDWRDNRTLLAARMSSVYGAYSQELLIKKFTLSQAGPDGSDVAAEPLKLGVSLTCGTHAFDTWMKNSAGVNTEVMGSPIVLRVVNKNPYNEMTGRDLTGVRRPIV